MTSGIQEPPSDPARHFSSSRGSRSGTRQEDSGILCPEMPGALLRVWPLEATGLLVPAFRTGLASRRTGEFRGEAVFSGLSLPSLSESHGFLSQARDKGLRHGVRSPNTDTSPESHTFPRNLD